MRWTLHRDVSPVKIVSLRTTQGYMAPDEPKAGHRLLVHALVRFDTEQVRISPSRCVGVDMSANRVLFSNEIESGDVHRARSPVARAHYCTPRLFHLFSRRVCDPAGPQRAVARPRAAAARDGVPRAREEGLGGVAVAVPRADVVGLCWDGMGFLAVDERVE